MQKIQKIIRLLFAFTLSPVIASEETHDTIHVHHGRTEPISLTPREMPKANSTNSIGAISQVRLEEIFDREQFLKEYVVELKQKQKTLESVSTCCSVMMMSWTLLAGCTTLSGILISSLGAADIISPMFANVLTIVFNVATGAFIWLAKESKNAAHDFYLDQLKILKSLGVPQRLFAPELDPPLELPAVTH
jgi:hypothetical protein